MGQPLLEISQALAAGERGRWKGWKEKKLTWEKRKQVLVTIPKHLFPCYFVRFGCCCYFYLHGFKLLSHSSNTCALSSVQRTGEAMGEKHQLSVLTSLVDRERESMKLDPGGIGPGDVKRRRQLGALG